jgi:hypothetical protein
MGHVVSNTKKVQGSEHRRQHGSQREETYKLTWHYGNTTLHPLLEQRDKTFRTASMIHEFGTPMQMSLMGE